MKKSNNRELILNEALRQFSMHGFNGVSIDRICFASNVKKPALYHYFKSKDGLYRTAYALALQNLTSINIWEIGNERGTLFRGCLYKLITHCTESVTIACSVRLIIIEYFLPALDLSDLHKAFAREVWEKEVSFFASMFPSLAKNEVDMLINAIVMEIVNVLGNTIAMKMFMSLYDHEERFGHSEQILSSVESSIDAIDAFVNRFVQGTEAREERVRQPYCER